MFLPLIWQQDLAGKQQFSIFSLDCSWPGSTFQEFWYSKVCDFNIFFLKGGLLEKSWNNFSFSTVVLY